MNSTQQSMSRSRASLPKAMGPSESAEARISLMIFWTVAVCVQSGARVKRGVSRVSEL